MRIICLGDSLMQFNGSETYPQEGWPQELKEYLKPEVEVMNFAKNGCSTKLFIDEGIFEEALKTAKAGDLVLICFGHNDEKEEDQTRYTDPKENGSYERNLSFMAETMRCKEAIPVLLSSIERLHVKDGKLEHSHGEYPLRLKKTAQKLEVPYIPLNEITQEEWGKDAIKAEENFMIFGPNEYPNYPKGSEDRTHLSHKGAKLIAGIVIEQLRKLNICKNLYIEA